MRRTIASDCDRCVRRTNHGGDVVAQIPLKNVTPHEAEPPIDQALVAIRQAAGRA